MLEYSNWSQISAEPTENERLTAAETRLRVRVEVIIQHRCDKLLFTQESGFSGYGSVKDALPLTMMSFSRSCKTG